WAYLPHDFPPHQSVYGYFARWAEEGIFAQLNGLLRQLLREKEGRDAEPSAYVIDAQSVKTSTCVPASSQGIDAGKKIAGRQRSIVTDTLVLLLTVLVTAASVQDSVAGTRLIDRVAAEHPTVRKVWVDGGYRQHLVEQAATLGIDMEITTRKPGTMGFTPIPKRWAVERTYGWLMLHRRLTRDYDTLTTRSEALVKLAMTNLMARRITGENTISWRDLKMLTTTHLGMKQRDKTTS
ncbi:IS5 family transposase, partial [Streptomyces sp. SID7760]|nr:IS5 family transposase [Streptomyces sp. SID7760]